MAQQTQQAGKSSTKNSPGTRNGATAPENRASRWNLSRFLAPRTDAASARGTSGAQGTTRPKLGLGKLLVGMLIFIVAAQVFEFALLWANGAFALHLEKPLASPNTPILGGLSAFMLLYLIIIFGIYMLLLRFNILPSGRSMREAERARQAQNASARAATSTRQNRHASRHNGNGASTSSGKSSRQEQNVVEGTAEPTADDVNYERVRAAQRHRKRRESRR
jgi:hypothetical protein